MERMGDVSKKTDAAEKAFDLKILQESLHKDKLAEKREQD